MIWKHASNLKTKGSIWKMSSTPQINLAALMVPWRHDLLGNMYHNIISTKRCFKLAEKMWVCLNNKSRDTCGVDWFSGVSYAARRVAEQQVQLLIFSPSGTAVIQIYFKNWSAYTTENHIVSKVGDGLLAFIDRNFLVVRIIRVRWRRRSVP